MADDDVRGVPAGTSARPPDEAVVSAVREILSVVPAGGTWLLPILAADGHVVDFRVASASSRVSDIHGRGTDRVQARLSELYPSMVDGPLWRVYEEVLATGEPGRLVDFRYEATRAGVVADSLFDVTVHPLLGGLLVWWQRVDEDRRRMEQTELLGRLGWAEYDVVSGRSEWSPGMYRIFDRAPALGPMTRAEQGAALLPEDRGLSEAAWQTLDSGAASDVTVRFRIGGSIRYVRVLSHVARDADGTPLKIYALLQDVTAREDSRSEIERLSDRLRRREITALAEHRLAGQLQNMIQPVPTGPFPLAGLSAMVGYLPAESTAKVGGDWYHAQTLPDGHVLLAIGDVAGHGLEAASGMAHLRYGLIAWLSTGVRDPGVLLEYLNRLCGQLAITGTAVVAVYDPADRVLRWARAGHMAPLLARAGEVAALDPPVGLLLGADPRAPYPVVRVPLCAGDVVLFYTDGLTVRRPVTTAAALHAVRQALSAASLDPAGQALPRLGAVLNRASADDDTCTLAVRVVPDVDGDQLPDDRSGRAARAGSQDRAANQDRAGSPGRAAVSG